MTQVELTLENYQSVIAEYGIGWDALQRTNFMWGRLIHPIFREDALRGIIHQLVIAKDMGEPIQVWYRPVEGVLYQTVNTQDVGLKPMPFCETMAPIINRSAILPLSDIESTDCGYYTAIIGTDKPLAELKSERRRTLRHFDRLDSQDENLAVSMKSFIDGKKLLSYLEHDASERVIRDNLSYFYPNAPESKLNLSLREFLVPWVYVDSPVANFFLMRVEYEGVWIATAIYINTRHSTYWLNTIADRSNPIFRDKQIGNYLIGCGLSYAHNRGVDYDLGMVIPKWDYKNLWKIELRPCAGFNFRK